MKQQRPHLSLVMLSSLAFFLLIIFPDVSNTSSCSWEGQVSSDSTLFSNSLFLSNTDAVVHINNVVERLQVHNLMPTNTQNVSAYRYFIVANVRCVDDGSDVGRVLFSRGGGAVITVSIPSETVTGEHITQKVLSLEGAPVEMDQSCSSAICDPRWVAPLPTSQDHHLIKVQISTRGGYHGIQSSQFIIHVDGYWREFESGDSPLTTISESINSRHIQDHLGLLKPTIVYYLSPLTSPMFLLSDERGLIFSSNDFKDNIFLQVTPTTVTRVCEEDTRFVVTLPDRILYGDSYAAFEIFGNFAVVSQQSMDFIAINEVSCIKAIIIPPHSYLVEWFIYLIGSDGLATDKVYQAIIHTDEPLRFLAVTDRAGSGACEFIKGGNTDVSCSVIGGAVSATTPNEAFFLLEMGAAECNIATGGCYYILQLKGSFISRTWKLVTNFPQGNCTLMNSDLCGIEMPLNLTGVTTTARPSRHIFLWGSTLIHCPDEGVTWHQVTDYNSAEIILLTTSADGQMVILNKDQEIWYGSYGSTVSLTKLRPSSGWQLNEVLTMSSEFNQMVKTISVYFDSYFALREVIVSEDESIGGKLSLSSRIIPAVRITQLEKESAPLRAGTMTIDKEEPPSCPFSRLLVSTELSSVERQEHYDLRPPSLTMSKLHDENSLLIYQGLLHLILDLREKGRRMAYAGDLHNPLEQLLNLRKPLEAYHDYIYRNRLLPIGIHITLQPFRNGGIQVREGRVFSLPAEVFLDKGDSYQFKIELRGWSHEAREAGLYHHQNLDLIQMMVEVSDLNLLQVNLFRRVDYLRDTVEYTVTLEDLASIGHKAPPGRLLQVSSFTLEAWSSALSCFEETNDKTETKGLLGMTVLHGCPPGMVLQYDINATILYNGISSVYECPQVDPNLPCVYFKHEFHPLFEVLDMTTGKSKPFTGRYTLKVIGGQGTQEDEMSYFTQEEISKYNWLDSNTLVWVPLAASKEATAHVFNRKNNGLVWRCKQFSPCSDQPLNFPWMPEYTFLVEVSNKDVASSSSYCEYTVQFMVKVHGLPISSQRSVRIVAWCMLLSCGIIGLFLLCDWNERRIWQRTKLWAQQGFKVHPNMGSREWGIQTSASGSESSFSSNPFGDSIAARRTLNHEQSNRAEITWNLDSAWTESKSTNTLDQISEEVESEVL